MKVIQLLPSVGTGIPADHDAFSIHRILRDMGFQSAVYGERLSRRLPEGLALPVQKLPKIAPEDVLIYHKSPGSYLTISPERFPCRKMMIFHGEIPPRFWKQYDSRRHDAAEQSMRELCSMADQMDFCMADTAYHQGVLRELNYRCPIVVRPLMIPFSDYAKAPDSRVMAKYEGSSTVRILTAGEITPNQQIEDVLQVFSCYQRYCQPDSKLLIVGGCAGNETYFRQLKRYAAALELEQVVFTGRTTFAEEMAYYRSANVFLSMGQPEELSLPLVKAMYFGVPAAVRQAGAAADTLGGSGLLLPGSDPAEAALAIDRMMRQPALRREILAGQRKRQQALAFPELRRLFENQFRDFLDATHVSEESRFRILGLGR